jgi:hypothetical protein
MDDEDDCILENENEREREKALEENRDAETLKYDDFVFDNDINGYLSALSVNLITLLNDNILDDVITKVSSDGKVISPREYNFTTDTVFLDFEVNETKLNEYVEINRAAYDAEKIKSCSGFVWFGDEQQTRLAWYLKTESTKHYPSFEYISDQFESVSAYEFIEYSRS